MTRLCNVLDRERPRARRVASNRHDGLNLPWSPASTRGTEVPCVTLRKPIPTPIPLLELTAAERLQSKQVRPQGAVCGTGMTNRQLVNRSSNKYRGTTGIF